MLTATIEASGKTQGDLEQALEEALKRIRAGNTSGFDSNDDGDFRFDVDGEEEPEAEESDDPYKRPLDSGLIREDS